MRENLPIWLLLVESTAFGMRIGASRVREWARKVGGIMMIGMWARRVRLCVSVYGKSK